MKILVCFVSVLLSLFSCACISETDPYKCIITSLETQESIHISDASIVERILRDVLSPVDFSSASWLDYGDGNFPLDSPYVYTVRILRNPTQMRAEELLIAIGQDSILVNGDCIDSDSVTLYLISGLFDGLSELPDGEFAPLR